MTPAEFFTAVYAEQFAHVRAIAARRVRLEDRDLIDDLVQEAFTRFWAHLQAGRPVKNPIGLLGTMTVRAAADHYRLCRSTRERATDLTDPVAGRIVPASPSAEDVAMMHTQIAALLASAGAQVAA